MEHITNLNIKYGELDIYYPLKFELPFSFETKMKIIPEQFKKYMDNYFEKCINKKDINLFNETIAIYEQRCEFITEEFKESLNLYGSTYTNSHERFVLPPLKIELSNKEFVWLHAILYIFKNSMCILKIEFPLKNVNNIPLKENNWDLYIHKASYVWNEQIIELTSFDEIKKMYISIIEKICVSNLFEYGEYLHHIIFIDFEGCPYNVNKISDDIQEELFRTIAASVTDAPYTSYRDEAKEYINNNSWGTHNIRCILKSTGGCLSILDRTVQDYWIQKYSQEEQRNLNYDEYLEMYLQYVNKLQNNTEFPLIILLLERINILNDIRQKNMISYKTNFLKNKEFKYEYLKNNIFINTLQEECCGTVSKQVAEFQRMMPYYTKKDITTSKHDSINEILRQEETETISFER